MDYVSIHTLLEGYANTRCVVDHASDRKSFGSLIDAVKYAKATACELDSGARIRVEAPTGEHVIDLRELSPLFASI